MAFSLPGIKDRVGETTRSDTWWLVPSIMAAIFVAFVIYAMWASIINPTAAPGRYYYDNDGAHFLSPFYSPNFSEMFPNVGFFKFFPAFWVVWLPSLFRLTCYYGRKAYYRSLLLSPPACAVGKGSDRGYKGETALPWVINNIHRYFFYLIVILVVFHWKHFFDAFSFTGGFGMSVGSLVIAADTILLTLYVASCHSFRHLIGGGTDCFSCIRGGETRHNAWRGVSWLNQFHNAFFWTSLMTVGFADLYVRMVAMGHWTDMRLF